MKIEQRVKIQWITLIVCAGMVAVTIILYNDWSSSVNENKADHYQKAMKEIDSTPFDCNQWIDYLNQQYHVSKLADPDFYNYIAHVYNHVKSLNCDSMPASIPDIQEYYK